MKFKHNKNKNTAFLYEVLLLEYSKTIITKDKILRNKILETLKKYFSKGTILNKEIKLFKVIKETENIDIISAEKIIQEAKKEYELIDKVKLNKDQTNLFWEIRKILNKQAFSSFIPSYKDLASISQIFNKDVSIKTRILLENEIIEKMSSKNIITEEITSIDGVVLKSFIKRFNEQYKFLLEEQKILLNKYIKSFTDNGLELKLFLNEEIARLKKELNDSLTIIEFKEDNIMLESAKKVLLMLESFSKENIDEKMITKVIKTQKLLSEIKQNDIKS